MLYDLTVVQFSKMLTNLTAILSKAELAAEAKKYDVSVLLNSRLAPDQFNLIRQVQIACDTAKLGVARLAGVADSAPKHQDQETSLPELQQRITDTLAYLATFTPEMLADAAGRQITQPRWPHLDLLVPFGGGNTPISTSIRAVTAIGWSALPSSLFPCHDRNLRYSATLDQIYNFYNVMIFLLWIGGS